MSVEVYTQVATVLILVVSNIVVVSMFISRISSKVKHCEDEILALKQVDGLIVDEIKTLHKIEGQLELLIAHFLTNKQ